MASPENSIQDYSAFSTQEEQEVIELSSEMISVGFVKDEQSDYPFVIMTPNAIKLLTDNHVKVFMQHGFSNGSAYTDMDYANVGVEFIDDLFTMSSMVRVLVKHQAFSEEQLEFVKYGQILLSVMGPNGADLPLIELLSMKRITALALHLIENETGNSRLDELISSTTSDKGKSIALSNFIHPYLLGLAETPNFRFALQKYPELIDSVYCFDGEICNRDIADELNLPYRNIITLCWDLN